MKGFLFSLLFMTTAFAAKPKPWIYFDLGDTIVDTSDMSKIKYFQGAKEYMEGLRDLGLNVAIMTNIPVSWGHTQGEKLKSLKDFIDQRWVDTVPFDWSIYQHILLPETQEEMKPGEGMYTKALAHGAPCPIGFVSENVKEVTVAYNLGFAAHLFVNDVKRYKPLDEIVDFLKNDFQGNWDPECFVE